MSLELLSGPARDQRIGRALRVAEAFNALVRPILSVMFGSAITYMAIVGTISSGEFLGVAAVVIGYLFQSREIEKANTRLAEQQAEMLGLARALPPPHGGPES
jgi:hypothetical protein